jgi:phage regulator Rha-like protein
MTHTTTIKKAPGTCDSKGLAADTTGADFPMAKAQGKELASQTSLALTTTHTEARIDSRLVAQGLGNTHKAVMSLIDRYRASFKAHGQLTFKKEVGDRKHGGGNAARYALLNEDQAFFLLNLSRNTEIVVVLKSKLITAFSEARRAADVRRTEYLPAHHAMHDAIKDKAAGSPNERFMHINANKALNQLAGVQAGCRAGAGTLQQSLLAVGSALAARAVHAAQDAQGLHQHIKNALKPLEGILSLGGASEAKP